MGDDLLAALCDICETLFEHKESINAMHLQPIAEALGRFRGIAYVMDMVSTPAVIVSNTYMIHAHINGKYKNTKNQPSVNVPQSARLSKL